MLNYKIYLSVILVLQTFTIPLQAENKAKEGWGAKLCVRLLWQRQRYIVLPTQPNLLQIFNNY